MALYAQKWPGKVSCLMETTTSQLPEFGAIKKTAPELPFSCITMKEGDVVNTEHLKGVSLVLASGDSHNQLHISGL